MSESPSSAQKARTRSGTLNTLMYAQATHVQKIYRSNIWIWCFLNVSHTHDCREREKLIPKVKAPRIDALYPGLCVIVV